MNLQPMFRRSPLLLGVRRTTFFQRISAKSVDVLILCATYFIGKALWFPLGVLAAGLLAAGQDSMGEGQSLGKRLIGLQVLEEPGGEPCSFQSSFLRNVPLFLTVITAPFYSLWAISLFVTVPVCCLELYLLANVETGVRLGDVIGNTLVVEYLGDTEEAPH